jgi:hypothetical protein
MCIVRTTVTIPDELARKAKQTTGKQRLSEAIIQSLTDYFRLKNRLDLLDDLFDHPVRHSNTKIKRDRKKRNWSA